MTSALRLLLPIVSLLLLGTACSMTPDPPSTDSGGQLSGTVSYRERMALRPGHRLEVELLDVSLADAPATLLGRAEVDVSGSGPVPFSVSYDPGDVQERRRYVLRATLRDADGKLAFTTTQAYPVLTPGSPTEGLELLLQRAP